MFASVVIPCYGREDKLERAIKSILSSPGSEGVQIILVDDASPVPVSSALLRTQDLVIRNEENLGAARSRNIGMKFSSGRNIYLLDSDDFFVDVDFKLDVLDEGVLYYCDVDSQGFSSNYPGFILRDDFFDYIFFKYRHVGQTSSLAFSANSGFYFDDSLPKHQDWDFVFSCLNQGVPVKKRNGRIYFDRSDQFSISRKVNFRKSSVWLEKLKGGPGVDDAMYGYIYYMIISYDRKGLGDVRFLLLSIFYLFLRKVSLRDVAVRFVRRYFSSLVSL